MTPEKAIEILQLNIDCDFEEYIPDTDKATQLGIEALKAVKECRASRMFCPGLIMPGETEE